MQDALSSVITGSGSLVAVRVSDSERCTHLPSWVARLTAMYSSSIVDSDRLDCFLLPQLTGSPTRVEDIYCRRLAVHAITCSICVRVPAKVHHVTRLEAYAMRLGILQIAKDALHRGPRRDLNFL